MTIKLIEGGKKIEAAITSIANRGKRLENDIHRVACSCLVHAELHGDITLANRLIEAVPALARKNALRDWFVNFGRFSYDAENKVLAYDKSKVTMADDAVANPFWNWKPEPEYKPFDLVKELDKLVTKAEKHANADNELDNIPSELLGKLEAIMPSVDTVQ